MTFIRKKTRMLLNFLKRLYINIYKSIFLRKLVNLKKVVKEYHDFSEIVTKIKNSGTSSLEYFRNDYTFEGGLYLQQNPYEYAALISLLKRMHSFNSYLEIGSASGGSCKLLNELLQFKEVTIIDDGKHPQAMFQNANFSLLSNLKQFVGDSHSKEAFLFLIESIKQPLDLAFIDGDHSYDGVLQDLHLVLKFSKKGTVLIFHDTHTSASLGVAELWIYAIKNKIIYPVAEFIGKEKPLGIGVAVVN